MIGSWVWIHFDFGHMSFSGRKQERVTNMSYLRVAHYIHLGLLLGGHSIV
jgi:hypothetical protein